MIRKWALRLAVWGFSTSWLAAGSMLLPSPDLEPDPSYRYIDCFACGGYGLAFLLYAIALLLTAAGPVFWLMNREDRQKRRSTIGTTGRSADGTTVRVDLRRQRYHKFVMASSMCWYHRAGHSNAGSGGTAARAASVVPQFTIVNGGTASCGRKRGE